MLFREELLIGYLYLSEFGGVVGEDLGSAKSVAVKGKNQVVDPLKLFNDNYTNLNKTFLTSLK